MKLKDVDLIVSARAVFKKMNRYPLCKYIKGKSYTEAVLF